MQVTIPLANLDHHVSLSFVATHGSDKSLLRTILDTYSLIQEQVVLASKLVMAPVTNGDVDVDIDIDASELLKEKVYFQQTAPLCSSFLPSSLLLSLCFDFYINPKMAFNIIGPVLIIN